MPNDFPHPELETDPVAAAQFSKTETARTEAAFCDATFAADLERATEILADDSYLKTVRRRGAWIYNFLRNADHPKGLWRRVPDGTALEPDGPWQTVFDLDAYCQETDEDWHWGGAEAACFDSERMLICLSWRGSDQDRLLEWDPATQRPVAGGFDLGPERNSAAWLDADTLLYATSTGEGVATRSGWPGRVVTLARGQDVAAAPVVFEVGQDDLAAYAGTFQKPDGGVAVGFTRIKVIGESEDRYHPDGLDQPGITLDVPGDTMPTYWTHHYAYVAGKDGPHAPGTLVLRDIGGTWTRVLFEPRPYASVVDHSIRIGTRYMMWVEQDRMQPRLRLLDLSVADAAPVDVALPVEAQSMSVVDHDASPSGAGPWQVTASGFIEPAQTWMLHIGDGVDDLRFEPLLRAPASFDATGMEVRLHEATSEDGTLVPYHIVLPAERDGPMPVLQYGYGGFGVALSPGYQRLRGPLWLVRGGAYVLAYIRGGAEFGRDWHNAAKRENRPLAFADFAAVAQDLVQRGYSTADKIGCHGGSNGGLLCTTMLTRYPERFGAVWASVAVTDMLRFHLFPSGAGWMDEYGDPDDATDRAMLLGYSPVHNVAAATERRYPMALIDTNDNDDRVDPSHSRRFAAALLEAGQPAFYHARAGGHGGGGSLKETAKEQVLGMAFLRYALAIEG